MGTASGVLNIDGMARGGGCEPPVRGGDSGAQINYHLLEVREPPIQNLGFE